MFNFRIFNIKNKTEKDVFQLFKNDDFIYCESVEIASKWKVEDTHDNIYIKHLFNNV